MRTWRAWTTPELRHLKREYPDGTSVEQIAEDLSRTVYSIKRKALDLGLRHPGHSSAQMIENFERSSGQPLVEIAMDYRERRLSRRDLAHAIGIERLALKNALPDHIWNTWPRMTIGRIDACRNRKAA